MNQKPCYQKERRTLSEVILQPSALHANKLSNHWVGRSVAALLLIVHQCFSVLCFPLPIAVRAGKILLSVDMLLLSVVFIYTGGSLLTGLDSY